MNICPTCNQVCKTAQGLAGHKRLKHQLPGKGRSAEAAVTDPLERSDGVAVLPGAEPDRTPVAPATQDPPTAKRDSRADSTGSEQALTRAEVRELLDDALQAFTRDVLPGMTDSMAPPAGFALHPHGLCDDGKCAPCRSQRRDEHLQGRRFLADELDRAIEWTGRVRVSEMLNLEGSDALADVLESWRDAGRPEPAKQIEVVR